MCCLGGGGLEPVRFSKNRYTSTPMAAVHAITNALKYRYLHAWLRSVSPALLYCARAHGCTHAEKKTFPAHHCQFFGFDMLLWLLPHHGSNASSPCSAGLLLAQECMQIRNRPSELPTRNLWTHCGVTYQRSHYVLVCASQQKKVEQEKKKSRKKVEHYIKRSHIYRLHTVP